jgi:hypothetical protein
VAPITLAGHAYHALRIDGDDSVLEAPFGQRRFDPRFIATLQNELMTRSSDRKAGKPCPMLWRRLPGRKPGDEKVQAAADV